MLNQRAGIREQKTLTPPSPGVPGEGEKSASRTIGVILLVAICLLAITGPASAEDAPTTAPSAFSASFLEDRSSHLADDLAALLQQRPDAPPAQLPGLDAQIDLRIVAHALLNRAAREGSDNDAAAAAYLRAGELLSAAGWLQQRAPKNSALTRAQADALTALHQATYELPSFRSTAQADEFCRRLSSLLQEAGGLPAVDLRQLGPQRPRPAISDIAGEFPVKSQTLAELTAAAHQAAVSPALRRQLIALADATAAQKDDAAYHAMLARAINLTMGLQQAGLVDGDAREKVESELAAGTTLFLDERTRGAGLHKVEKLEAYRRMLDAVAALNLSPNLQADLGPACAWAQRHIEQGPRMIEILRNYKGACALFDAAKPPSLPPAPQRALDAVRRQFSEQRQAFLSDAAKLAQADANAEGAPGILRYRLDAMVTAQTSINLIVQAPDALAALAAYKPRPVGALERHALLSMNALAGLGTSPTPEHAKVFLINLEQLARSAAALSAAAKLPPDWDKQYARGHIAVFSSRYADRLTELASQAASGHDLDRRAMGQLDELQAMLDSLSELAAADAVIRRTDVMRQWVDWNVAPETLGAVLTDLRDATAASFDAVADGNLAAADKWMAIHDRAEPMMSIVTEVSEDADACAKLPTGWPGALASLQTPMDRQPFKSERLASLMLAAWERAHVAEAPVGVTMRSPTEKSETETIFDALCDRLKNGN